jgi:hypothetical protein
MTRAEATMLEQLFEAPEAEGDSASAATGIEPLAEEIRIDDFAKIDLRIARIVECEHQPPFTPDGKMRFPVFCRLRDPSDVDPKVLAAYEAFKAAS